MKLIDADELISSINNNKGYFIGTADEASEHDSKCDFAISIIENADEIGESDWVCLGTSKYVYEEVPNTKWHCNSCGKEFRIPFNADYRYCPYCARKIRKVYNESIRIQ